MSVAQQIITAAGNYAALDAWLEGFHDTEASVRRNKIRVTGKIPAPPKYEIPRIVSKPGQLVTHRRLELRTP